MKTDCPTDDELLPLAAGEPADDGLRAHVDQCPICLARVDQLRREMTELQSLAVSMGSTSKLRPAAGPSVEPLPNSTKIGRYVVIGNLGSGGQADVYRVIDPNLERQLVLKLSRQHADGPAENGDAVSAEGRLLAELDHPGLIRVFDVGIFQKRPYLVLEHVPGRNLEQLFSTERPAFRDAARITAEMARVLAYAHRRGVVHGDVTPKNILIDAHGRARLIDFGLSRMEDAWGENARLTGGTPEYLPPEMALANGRLGRAVPASDVFGLGATLFWMLTGRAPFAGTTVNESLAHARRGEVDFTPLRTANVPRRLRDICRKCLAADPAARPAPDAVAAEIERFRARGRVWVVVTAATLLLASAIATAWWLTNDRKSDSLESVNFVHSRPVINVLHRDGVRMLSNALPLRTGDRIFVYCHISQGEEAVMLWFNPAGQLKIIRPVRDVAENVDRLVVPAPHRSLTLEPPEGTEMLFFCCGDDFSEQELRACFPEKPTSTNLPPHNWLTVQRSEVKIEGPLATDIPDDILAVEESLKEINRQLKQHFKSVTGIVFPHHTSATHDAPTISPNN
ncbi:serine/threonine-protein kinase [Schlesneria paludicola]|uniref:serine/threonine-protein kinase n=1 Tax=Schlesneria paludicola TaxID=360056 RepID=UPI000299EE0F|nr:serine/threonine-protein kinase [Schlesneria paludicola]